MNICLGTAQFGLDYGITNKTGKIRKDDISTLLKRAFDSNIITLDTAIAYGNSEDIIGDLAENNFSVITKLPSGMPVSDIDLVVKNSLRRLKKTSLHGLLFHSSADLLSIDARKRWGKLVNLKDEGIINNIGISTYSLDDFFKVTDLFAIDCVQFPLNCFDQRFRSKEFQSRCKELNITCYARSLFLQGTLLSELEHCPTQLVKYKESFKSWINFCNLQQISLLEGCLLFAQQQGHIDNWVIGVSSLSDLNKLLCALKKIEGMNKSMYTFNSLASEDPFLINPSLWESVV